MPTPTTLALLPSTPDDAERLVEVFLAGRSPRTLLAYRRDIQTFADRLPAAAAPSAAAVLLAAGQGRANGMVLQWRAEMIERGLAAATINRRLAAIRSLVKLARTLGLVAWTLEVPSVDGQPYRDTRGPSVDSVRAMLRVLQHRTDEKAIRDRAIVRCLFDVALRRGELTSLDVEHVDLDAGTMSVLGKGRRARETLAVPAPTCAALKAWIDVRGSTPGPLFTTMHRGMRGQRLTGDGVASIISALGRAAGIRARVRPHGLRHAGITRALDATGGDIRTVQRFSRHRDVRTLMIYDDNRRDLAKHVADAVAMAV